MFATARRNEGLDNARITIGKHSVWAWLRHPFDDHGILVAEVWNYLNHEQMPANWHSNFDPLAGRFPELSLY
jgi:hypothetical protein